MEVSAATPKSAKSKRNFDSKRQSIGKNKNDTIRPPILRLSHKLRLQHHALALLGVRNLGKDVLDPVRVGFHVTPDLVFQEADEFFHRDSLACLGMREERINHVLFGEEVCNSREGDGIR